MKLIFCKHIVLIFILIFVLSCTISIVEGNAAKPEKIFRHDREPEKLSRIDMENDELQRALEELRRRVPEYTGYLVVDVIFEIVKMTFILLLRVLSGQQPNGPNGITP